MTYRQMIAAMLGLFYPFISHAGTGPSFRECLRPVPRESGFKMDGYWVWGGSVVKVDGIYHLFASRWPKTGPFPEGYRQHSEIVRATATNLVGPYEFKEVVIGEREQSYWDSNMAHNPTIQKIGDTYVLFYIGSDFKTLHPNGNLYRSIGYATAKSIEGPWIRSDKPVISEESNNPSVVVEQDGAVKMIFRDAHLKVKIATADHYKGPYKIENSNVWPACQLEDFYLFKRNNTYQFICEDNVAGISGHERWGVHLTSNNGIDGWKPHNPVVVYDHDIVFTDGGNLNCTRRERPQLYIENGKVKALFTAVYDGKDTWCQPVMLQPAY